MHAVVRVLIVGNLPSGRFILNEKFAAAEYRCRPVEKQFLPPFHGLRSSGRKYSNGRFHSGAVNRRHSRSRRTCARRHGFSSSTLAEPYFDLMLITDAYQLDVGSLREVRMYR